MSTLIVSELIDRLTQRVRPKRTGQLKALRPHLVIVGSPAGSLKVEVTDANDRVIATSNSLTISSLKSLSYAHKYVRFDITCPVIKAQDYAFHLVPEGGYAFSESAYVGVAIDWDDTKVDVDYVVQSDFEKPLDFESWIRGRV